MSFLRHHKVTKIFRINQIFFPLFLLIIIIYFYIHIYYIIMAYYTTITLPYRPITQGYRAIRARGGAAILAYWLLETIFLERAVVCNKIESNFIISYYILISYILFISYFLTFPFLLEKK